MQLDKDEVDKLLQGEVTKERQATEEEKNILQAELIKLIRMYREKNKREMLAEMISLVNSLDQLDVRVVSEAENMLHFTIEPVSGQEYAETFFCSVKKRGH